VAIDPAHLSDLRPGYLRYPHLHGDRITFVSDDDVWLAPLDGGLARRLTGLRAPVAGPRFSPDGVHVAFTSARDAAPEVYVAPAAGGEARRLTFWGSSRVAVLGWTDDGRVVAATWAGEPFASRTWAYAVPLDGGPAQRLPYGPVTAVAYGSGGAVVLATGRWRDPAQWKRYRGGTAGRLWIDAEGSGTFTRYLAELDGQLASPMWVGDRVAFLSDHEGHGNVYSARPDGSDLHRHTDHDTFYARSASTDGTRVLYGCAGSLWLLDGLDGAGPRQLEVRLDGLHEGRRPHPVPAGEHLGDFAPDRTGRGSAVVVRGALQWVTHRDGPVRALVGESGIRSRLPQVLGRSGRVVWVTDAEGDDALEVAPVEGRLPDEPPRRLLAGRLGRVLEVAAAPDGHTVAVATHDGRVVLVDVDVEDGAARTAAESDDGDASGLAFSPDSAWLAWSAPGPYPLRRIRLAAVEDLSGVDATPLRFRDTEPVFTPDGRHLAFLSHRTFDPVYDEHVFDLSFPLACRPYLLPLAAGTPSPFDPELAGRDPEQATGGTGSGADTAEHPAAPVQLDLEGLADRVVPVPVAAGRYRRLRAAVGGLLWLDEPLAGVVGDALAGPEAEPPRPTLRRFDLARRRCDVLVETVDAYEVSGDGRRLVVRDGKSLRVLPADRKLEAGPGGTPPEDEVRVDLDRIRVVVDPPAQWRQMYDEAGRLMRDHFWVEDLAGVDWPAALDRYRPLLERIGTRDELSDLIWEVQGELGASHAYEVPPQRPAEAARALGLLGADLSRDADGTWRVARVLPSEPSNPKARSPLAAAGAGVRVGDALLAVDGRAVDPATGPGPLLVGAAGRPVELTVAPGDGAPVRRVVVVPVQDEGPLRYQDWVAGRRATVHTATEGRVGYLHVPDMVGTGWAQLHRDLRLEVGRDGLVVDVRDNNGGHTSELVIEKIVRRVIGWQMPRGARPTTYPTDAPRGPVVAVTNEHAGSDGDIVTAAIKSLGIGPVVGMRTWGGVIGIDMRYDLVDGTSVTQPRYAFWFDGLGWDVENYGVEPDVEVPYPPQDWAAGSDPQLDRAVRMALEALGSRPVARPPDRATRASRRPPELPPRR
jgi:tricorn protease